MFNYAASPYFWCIQHSVTNTHNIRATISYYCPFKRTVQSLLLKRQFSFSSNIAAWDFHFLLVSKDMLWLTTVPPDRWTDRGRCWVVSWFFVRGCPSRLMWLLLLLPLRFRWRTLWWWPAAQWLAGALLRMVGQFTENGETSETTQHLPWSVQWPDGTVVSQNIPLLTKRKVVVQQSDVEAERELSLKLERLGCPFKRGNNKLLLPCRWSLCYIYICNQKSW